jgi:hypothetical protein
MFYQIQKIPPGLRPKYVWVEERMNGKMFVMYKACYFFFKEIEIRLPKQKSVRKCKRVRVRKMYIPPEDHPWKRFRLPSAVLKERNREQQRAQTE